MNLKESIKRILREDSRVYDYDPKRNTVPFDERLPFDVDKLLSVGAVFITPAIDGDPKSKTYKEWLNEPYVHLITLKNVFDSNPDSWIHKAITKKGDPELYRKDFVYKFYDGKYNQILWSLEKLGIDPNDMIEDKDNSIQESIKRILREETDIPIKIRRRLLPKLIENAFQTALDGNTMLKTKPGSMLHKASFITFANFVIDDMVEYMEDQINMDGNSYYYGNDDAYIEEIRNPLLKHYGDRIKKRYDDIVGGDVFESVLEEETNIPLQVKRRINGDSLAELIHDIKSLIDSGYDESDAIYDTVRQFIASKQFKLNNDSEQSYWDSYIEVEEPLVDYLKSKLNIRESVIQEEMSSMMRRIFRRVDPEKMDGIFGEGLDTMTTRYIQNQHNWHAMNLDKFKSGIVSYVIVDLCMKYSDVCFGAEDYYNQVWEFLLNNYSDVMEEKWNEIMSEDINESVLKENKVETLVKEYLNKFGLSKTSEIMGISIKRLIEIAKIPIDSNIAKQILVEMMNNDELKKKYREFEIHASSNGVFYWESMTNTGHFPGDVVENITVAATPFWDGVKYTPVELDWFTLLNEYGDIVYETSGEGNFYKELKHQTNFESVDELLNWYEEFYLPNVYDIVMNTLLPKMHRLVDYEIKQRG